MNLLIVTSSPTRYRNPPGLRVVRPGALVRGFAADVIEVQLREPPPDMLRFMAWFEDEVIPSARPETQFRLPKWLMRALQR